MTTKQLKNLVLRSLGLTTFAKRDDGGEQFTEEQRKQLVDQFGEPFVKKFESIEFSTSVSTDSDPTPTAGTTELIDLIGAAKRPEIESLQAQLNTAIKRNDSLQSLVDAMSELPETLPAADGVRVAVANLERKFKINSSASHYQGASQFLSNQMATTPGIDVSDLKSEFGLYLDDARNADMHKQVFLGFETSKYMTTRIADHEFRASQGIINSVVQQFSPKWTPSGKVKFTPIVIKNRRHKINVELIPNDIVESWLLYLYDESLSADKMPITKYITQQMILPKILEDIEMRMIAKGKYDETATAGQEEGDSGVPPEKGMDGFETILAKAKKVAGTENDMGVNFIDMDFDYRTCTDEAMLEFTAKFVDAISPFFRRKDMPVFCSAEFYQRYKRAYKKVYGIGSANDDPNFGGNRIDYSTCVLTPLQSMYASPILFTTPKENFIKLRRQRDTTQLINDVQKVDYKVKLFGEFWLGAGFAIGEAITAFVPAKYDPYATIAGCLGASDSLSQKRWLGSNASFDTSSANEESGA